MSIQPGDEAADNFGSASNRDLTEWYTAVLLRTWPLEEVGHLAGADFSMREVPLDSPAFARALADGFCDAAGRIADPVAVAQALVNHAAARAVGAGN